MLKALELSGFKSFADKTRFEFPPGITVVVGPNGSGKSNIVDAIKWVLGEQSAKSLRGKEMSDVIFKGSGGPNARRPSNSAQATLVLENEDRRLQIDVDEVHISRRVYRSGETEYLINGETSRLKDIKNLIRGTGVGTDAYSLIEQGKVERMLSTSPKERRAIFEEAAGISRFKAKKVQAERRLARVEGNLIRLADIVEEVGSRYRSVKAQASKAARYKEYSDRLQELRTTVGMTDWVASSEKLLQLEVEQKEHADRSQELDALVTKQVESSQEVESSLDEITALLATKQERSTTIREEIAKNESELKINESRLHDIDQRKSEFEEQSKRAEKRTTELTQRIEMAEKDFEAAELKFRDADDRLKQLESEQAELDETISSFRNNSETRRSKYLGLMSMVTEIGRLVSAADSELQNGTKEKLRLESLVARINNDLEEHRTTYHRHQTEQERLKKEAESTDGALAEARKSFEQYREELAGRKDRLGEIRNRHAGLTQRAKVIQELEKSLEGVNAGAKELLKKSGRSREGYLGEIVGLVADLVSVNVQHAGIVDVALGELAQYIVVDGNQLVDQLASETLKLDGRVGLIQLSSPPSLGADPSIDLNGAPGVIGRADRLVQVEPAYADFVRKLLGGTWVVKTLAHAIELHQSGGRKVRLVTLDGEIVESDGTVIAGPKSVTTGLVSRRSELRALKRELEKLSEEIETCVGQVKELTELESTAEEQVQRLISENSGLASELSQQTNQADAALSQIRKLESEHAETQSEFEQTVTSLQSVDSKLNADRQRLATNELEVSAINQLMATEESNANEAQSKRNGVEKELTKAKVAAAKNEQQLEDLQARLAQYRSEFEEHKITADELTTRFQDDVTARQTSDETIKAATSKLAELATEKDLVTDELGKVATQRTEVDSKRRELAIELTAKRDELRTVNDRLSQAKLRVEQITMQRQQLAERMQEDYGIDISSLDYVSNEDILERETIDKEIADLRKKIGQIGSVNLDSLTELEELEARYTHMDGQYQDLVEAKESLEKIIVRINADSRKLFVETLEAIRINFQKLFRQTFGGGQADIILEEGVDPLEAGVEIIATPPGKPQFNNSLLSGGEKALTAVSLLMAIFQFRPSPFCVLDEVDAPFDEANIGRFIEVLKSFLGWTKFVIVTHSKKTMTAATTLYGITMQESGISKRVSVRFEDVSEDGEISEEAIHRGDEDAA